MYHHLHPQLPPLEPSIPLVNVTAYIHDQNGNAVAGAVVKMKLSTPEKYNGLVVPNEIVRATDMSGIAILQVFPNELGSEGSEYDVYVQMNGARPPMHNPAYGFHYSQGNNLSGKTLHFHVVVPNTDCNLFDIVNLPPYERRGAGTVLDKEVASYAFQAAGHAEKAKSYVADLVTLKSDMSAQLNEMQAAKIATQASQISAQMYAEQCRTILEDIKLLVETFKGNTTQQAENEVRRLIQGAAEIVEQARTRAVNDITQARDNALNVTNATTSSARTEAVNAVNNARAKAVQEIETLIGTL